MNWITVDEQIYNISPEVVRKFSCSITNPCTDHSEYIIIIHYHDTERESDKMCFKSKKARTQVFNKLVKELKL